MMDINKNKTEGSEMLYKTVCEHCKQEVQKVGHSFWGGTIYFCSNIDCKNHLKQLHQQDVQLDLSKVLQPR